ncbi:MAG: ABC transporter permease subunit [Promethearchaeota archaeon]
MIRLNKLIWISRKDWKEIRYNKQILIPMLVVPFLLTVFMPIVLIMIPIITSAPEDLSGLEDFVPEYLASDTIGAFVYFNMNVLMKPFVVLIPLLVTAVISSDSWAGEKERKTAESLLLLPLTDSELFLAKVLSSLIPGLLISWSGSAMIVFLVDIATLYINGNIYFPDASWIFLTLVSVPAMAFFSIFVNVYISSKSKDTKSAQQLGGSVVVIFFGFLISGFVGMMDTVLYISTAAFGIFDIIMVYFSPRIFSREKIMTRI